MKLSKLEVYLLDCTIDDQYGLWEMIADDNLIVELNLPVSVEIRKTALIRLVKCEYMRLVQGDIGRNKVKDLGVEEAIQVMQQEESWSIPPNLKNVYAVYTLPEGERILLETAPHFDQEAVKKPQGH